MTDILTRMSHYAVDDSITTVSLRGQKTTPAMPAGFASMN